MSWDNWQEQERREEEERQWAEQEYIELHRDEPSPFCPECEYMPSKCNCMVYGRKLFPTKEEPYDWHTRREPLYNEDAIEIMRFQDWIGDKGDQWRSKNIPPDDSEIVLKKTIKLDSGYEVKYYEVINGRNRTDNKSKSKQ
jgi:hypothetical protein